MKVNIKNNVAALLIINRATNGYTTISIPEPDWRAPECPGIASSIAYHASSLKTKDFTDLNFTCEQFFDAKLKFTHTDDYVYMHF